MSDMTWHLEFFRVSPDGTRAGGDIVTDVASSIELAIAEGRAYFSRGQRYISIPSRVAFRNTWQHLIISATLCLSYYVMVTETGQATRDEQGQKNYKFEKWNPSAGKHEMAPRLRDPQIYRNGRRRNSVKSASAKVAANTCLAQPP